MKKYLLLPALFLFFAFAKGQTPLDSTFISPSVLNFDEFMKAVHYPKAAKKAKAEGQVVVSVMVDEMGRPGETKVIEEINPALAKEVIAKVHVLRFRAGMQNGRAIPCRVVIPVDFKME
jgi:periplasmic protein TonB